jgi:hypothetical protein
VDRISKCAAPLLIAWSAAACGGGSGSGHSTAPVEILDGIIIATATVSGSIHDMVLVDTGSPFTLLPVSTDSNHTVPNGEVTVPVDLGGYTFGQVPVIGTNLLGTGGIVGCTTFCSAELTINYRDRKLSIGAPPMIDGVQPAVSVGFQLKGGGKTLAPDGSVVTFGASRVRIVANIEGQDHTLILDTGSEFVGLRSSIVNQLIRDGRGTGQMSIFTLNMRSGSSGTLTRIRMVTVQGVEVERIVGLADTSVDQLLDNVSTEMNETIDGLLGAPFLKEFNLSVDYPNRTVVLSRYTTRDHIIDWNMRVGVELGVTTDDQHIAVTSVHPNTDAERKGVKVGDVLNQIDGVTYDAKSSQLDVFDHLSGSQGTTHTIQFGCMGCAGFMGERTIAVDDLLPLP